MRKATRTARNARGKLQSFTASRDFPLATEGLAHLVSHTSMTYASHNVFLTLNENERPSAAGHLAKAWPSVELSPHEFVFLCAWSCEVPGGWLHGTAFVLFEHDLMHWLGQPKPQVLTSLQALEPASHAWQLRNVRAVWRVHSEAHRGSVLVFADEQDSRFTVSPHLPVPLVDEEPLWTLPSRLPVEPEAR